MDVIRYNRLASDAVVPDAMANAEDTSLCSARWSTGLYFLQTVLRDQYAIPVSPVGLDTQLTADWNTVLQVTENSYRVNVHNIVTAFALISRVLDMFNYGENLPNRWSYYAWYVQVPSAVGDKFTLLLSASPTISQCRAFISQLDLRKVCLDAAAWIDGNLIRIAPNARYIPPYHAYTSPATDTMVVALTAYADPAAPDLAGALSVSETPTISGPTNGNTDNSIIEYCAGIGPLAAADGAAAEQTFSANEQTFFAYQSQSILGIGGTVYNQSRAAAQSLANSQPVSTPAATKGSAMTMDLGLGAPANSGNVGFANAAAIAAVMPQDTISGPTAGPVVGGAGQSTAGNTMHLYSDNPIGLPPTTVTPAHGISLIAIGLAALAAVMML